MTVTRNVLDCLDIEMCANHFACDLIESKLMDAFIILTDIALPLLRD
jgi:hypothetical protein